MQDHVDNARPGMSDGPGTGGAIIVPFPPRPNRRPAPRAHEDTDLSRALVRLNQALAEQREAVGAWRTANTALAASLSTLGASFARLEAGLAPLASLPSEPITPPTNL